MPTPKIMLHLDMQQRCPSFPPELLGHHRQVRLALMTRPLHASLRDGAGSFDAICLDRLDAPVLRATVAVVAVNRGQADVHQRQRATSRVLGLNE